MREPGEDDDTPLPPGFIDELRRLDREREASTRDDEVISSGDGRKD
jgi:hypothetical protein